MRVRVRRSDDRGAANILAIPAAAGLIAAAVLVITMLGSAAADSRNAQTAADAAALAAARAWRTPLATAYATASTSTDPAVFWSFPGNDIGTFSSPAVVNAARDYAQANEAELLEVSVDPRTASVTVRVRHRDVVPETGERMEQSATAQMALRGGACRSGRVLGYRIGGACVTGLPPAPPAPPAPTPDPTAPSPTPTPTPFSPPSSLGGFVADLHLTR